MKFEWRQPEEEPDEIVLRKHSWPPRLGTSEGGNEMREMSAACSRIAVGYNSQADEPPMG